MGFGKPSASGCSCLYKTLHLLLTNRRWGTSTHPLACASRGSITDRSYSLYAWGSHGKIDLKEVNEKLVDIEKRIAKAAAEHNGFLKELGLDLI